MPAFNWTRRPTRHFGDVWVSIVAIQILDRSGRFRPIRIQIDTGAVVSILNHGAAKALGVDVRSGRPIDLGPLVGARLPAYVHELTVSLDMIHSTVIPFAFCELDDIPNLLGRNGVFDQFEMLFDARHHETRIIGPST